MGLVLHGGKVGVLEQVLVHLLGRLVVELEAARLPLADEVASCQERH